MNLTLFLLFLKIGITCFGGGYGMMSMIFDEGSKQVGLTINEFTDMAALELICPGPIALNSSTYIGYLKGGASGSFFATLGLILPTVTVSILTVLFMKKFSESPIVRGLFRGITPACGGLLIYTSITLMLSAFFGSESIYGIHRLVFTRDTIELLILFIFALLLEFRYKIDPVLITVIGAVYGLIFLH
ncbi:MAG: chromate transporter [Anaerolineaceae bacterium]|nr:chromate transporter [Anaerolineaceae bacterium]